MNFWDVYNMGFFNKTFFEKVVEEDHTYYRFCDNQMTYVWLILAGISIVAYLIGSLNFSILISKLYGKDVRDGGSGNAGATNMTRQFGKKAGIFTFLGDFLKSALACIGGIMLLGTLGGIVAGLFCIVGHAFPAYFKFKGGKGVACVAAVALVTSPKSFLILLAIYAVLLLGFKMVSFASIMTVLIYPFMLSRLDFPSLGPQFLIALVIAALIVFLHRKNLVRIFNHTEPKISLGKKNKNKGNSNENSEE
ncbi:MAG: glycerol-3-phosphate 1-O-acyltransferase PlsY [Clostridia bacterium]|nr:glycerol-3-phosphate 1-O-acyltransferase PlsY [Clostridia bacterium]